MRKAREERSYDQDDFAQSTGKDRTEELEEKLRQAFQRYRTVSPENTYERPIVDQSQAPNASGVPDGDYGDKNQLISALPHYGHQANGQSLSSPNYAQWSSLGRNQNGSSIPGTRHDNSPGSSYAPSTEVSPRKTLGKQPKIAKEPKKTTCEVQRDRQNLQWRESPRHDWGKLRL